MEILKIDPEGILEMLRVMLASVTDLSGVAIHIHRKRGVSLSVNKGDLIERRPLDSLGVGLKLARGHRFASVSSSQVDTDSLRTLIAEGMQALQGAAEDPFDGIYPCELPPSGARFESVDIHYSQVLVDEKINRLLNLEGTLLKTDARITGTVGVRYQDLHCEEWLWTTGSAKVLQHSRTVGYLEAGVIATQGKFLSIGKAQSAETFYFDLDWSGVARDASAQALKTLGGEAVPTGVYPVILKSHEAGKFLAAMAPAFYSDLGSDSFLSSRIGEEAFSSQLNIFDDPFLKKSVFARIWDAEGTPTQRLSVVERGRLLHLCYSRRTAKKHGTRSTGHLLREDFNQTARIGFHQLVVEPGRKDFVDLLRDMGQGIVVYEIKGFDKVDFKTGEFVCRVAGTWVEKGEEVRAVDQIALAGNFIDTWSSVLAVGRDQKSSGSLSTPSILFGKQHITGA